MCRADAVATHRCSVDRRCPSAASGTQPERRTHRGTVSRYDRCMQSTAPGIAQRIVLASTKGGVGKSLLGYHIAAYAAVRGWNTALVDCDSQRCAAEWHALRRPEDPPFALVAADDPMNGPARSWSHRLTPGTQVVVIDTPAGMRAHHLTAYVRNADTLLVPMQPSVIDQRANRHFMTELSRLNEVRSGQLRVGIVINRAKLRTLALRELIEHPDILGAPLAGVLRESQAYSLLAGLGKSLFDYPSARLDKLRDDWQPVLRWLGWNPGAQAELGGPTPNSTAHRL